MSRVSHSIDRVRATFDDLTLVANAGLLLPATLMVRLGLEALVDSTVRQVGRVGGALPDHKVLTLVTTTWRAAAALSTPTCCARGDPVGAALPGDGAVHAGHLPAANRLGR